MITPDELFVRVPPSSLESEQAVLGAVLIDDAVLDEVRDILSPSDFYRAGHRAAYVAMTELGDRDAKIDLVTLKSYLDQKGELEKVGGPAYLASLPDITPSAANAPVYAKTIREKAILRSLISAVTDIGARAYEEPTDMEQFLADAQAAVFDIGQGQTSTLVDIPQVLKVALSNIEQLTTTGKLGLSTGLPDLDRISYGLGDENLIIVAGRPGSGKTAFALSVLTNTIDRGGRGGMFSLEMGAPELMQRMVNFESGTRPRPNTPLQKTDWDKIISASNKIRGLRDRMLIDVASIITPTQIKARARRWKSQGPLNLVIVDYLQLVSNPLRNRSRESEVAEVSKAMKAMAKDLKCPVMLLSQLNRTVESRESKAPRLSDLRESGAIEQDADEVFFLYEDDENHCISVAKHRNGPRGTIEVHVDWTTGRFRCIENQRTTYQDD